MTPQEVSAIARLRARNETLEAQAVENKRALQSLATTSAKANSVLEVAVDGIITIDESGTIESVNSAVARIFGYKPHQLIGHNVKKIMPASFAEEHDEYLARYRRTGDRHIIGIGRELLGRRRDGSVFPLELSVSEGFDGTRRFFTGLIHDITDRKELQHEVRESKDRLQAILASAVDGILSIDEMGVVEAMNSAAAELFGYRREELIGRNVKCLMPAPYAEEHDGYLTNYRASGLRKIIGSGREVTGLRRNGTTFPMYLAVSEGLTKHRRVFTGIVRDLTERDAAKETEASLAAIVEESLNEIFVFHAETLRFLQVNREARENLGYSLEDLRELTPLDIEPYMSIDEFRRLIAPLKTGSENRLQFGTVHQRKDGSHYPVDVHLQRGIYEGEPAFIALIFDMTERKEAVEALKRAEERARHAEKLASIATLIAGIAHDIGTPMSVILGYANMMESALEDEKLKELARLIGSQTQRVTDLIQTLLNISRPSERTPMSIQIAPILDHSLQFYREKLRKHGITVDRDFSGVPNVLGDRDQLEQVFLNLFVNAADAMPSGGTLSVRCRTSGPDTIEILVRDTGTGIEPSDLTRVFEPFYTTKARGEGNGLGLLVSQRIVVEHGGSISVSSVVGEGTEFRITLPCSIPSPAKD